MPETPSGNRWEPSSGLEEHPAPLPPSYEAPPAPAAAAGSGRVRRRGRVALVVAGLTLASLASVATGYAIGHASGSPSNPDQVTRQGPSHGFADDPGHEDGSGDNDHGGLAPDQDDE